MGQEKRICYASRFFLTRVLFDTSDKPDIITINTCMTINSPADMTIEIEDILPSAMIGTNAIFSTFTPDCTIGQ